MSNFHYKGKESGYINQGKLYKWEMKISPKIEKGMKKMGWKWEEESVNDIQNEAGRGIE